MITLLPWVRLYLLLHYDESCVIIFAFRAKLPHFLAFLQFHLSTSISGMLPDIIFVFILSHWKQFLRSLFFLKSFVPLKPWVWWNECHECHEFGGIIWHTSISEVKRRWDWSPHGLWQLATLACLPNFSIWTDALTKIQITFLCFIWLVIGSITTFTSLLALDNLPQKSLPKSVEEKTSLIIARLACSLSHGGQFLTMSTLPTSPVVYFRHSKQALQNSALSFPVPN